MARRLTRSQILQRIREMQTVEMFSGQERFIQRNITELGSAMEQASAEMSQIILGTHPRYRRIIASLREGARPIGRGGWTDRRLLSLLDTIDEMSEDMQAITQESIIRTSSAVASDVYENYPDILSFGNRLPSFNSTELTIPQIRAYVEDTVVGGEHLQSFVGRLFNDYAQADIRNEMFVGALQGEGIPKLTRRIQEKFNWLDQRQINRITRQARSKGLEGSKLSNWIAKKQQKVIRQNAITAARTHMQTVAVDSMTRVYSNNSDIIKEYEWNATMEPGYTTTGRGTCLRCAALDGQTYATREEMPTIPLHPNCRCLPIPITKSWQELGINSSQTDNIIRRNRPYAIRESDAQMVKGKGRSIGAGGRRILGSAGQTSNRDYNEWFENRNSFFKMNVAGPSRAKWLEEGRGRTLSDLVDRSTGELINLEDLAGSTPVISRSDYIRQYGSADEASRM